MSNLVVLRKKGDKLLITAWRERIIVVFERVEPDTEASKPSLRHVAEFFVAFT